MRSSTMILLSSCAVLLMVQWIDAASFGSNGCPPPNKVYSYDKRDNCRDSHDCKQGGKVCCPNPAGSRSCVTPDYSYSNNNKDKYNNNKYANDKKNIRG